MSSPGETEERRPLLGGADLESRPDDAEQRDSDKKLTWREWTAEKLEAPTTHSIVIALIAIDASCVLADLIYTFLNPECPPVPSPS
ncbi:hypothetical protein M0805_003230, partial [Coniferiporia weirii]